MINCIDQVYYRMTNIENKNILYMPYTEEYENISTIDNKHFKLVNDSYFIYPINFLPNSYKPFNYSDLSHNFNIDLIFCSNRNHQASHAEKFSKYYHSPLVLYDHALPMGSSSMKLRSFVNANMPLNSIFIYPHDIVREEWADYEFLESEIIKIPYGIKKQEIEEKINDVFIYGDPLADDYELIESLESEFDVIKISTNKEQDYQSFEDIEEGMRRSKVFINLNGETEPPIKELIAASFGCSIITNETKWSSAVFTNEENAILLPNESLEDDFILLLQNNIKELLEDNTTKISKNAREMVSENFSVKTSKDGWDTFFKSLRNRVYIR